MALIAYLLDSPLEDSVSRMTRNEQEHVEDQRRAIRRIKPHCFAAMKSSHRSRIALRSVPCVFPIFLLLLLGCSLPSSQGFLQIADKTTTLFPMKHCFALKKPVPKQQQQQLMHLSSWPGRPGDAWEGDDLRRSSKLRRRFRREFNFQNQPVRNSLILLLLFMYGYQTVDAIAWVRRTYPDAWPQQALAIVWDTVWGRVRPQNPLVRNLVHVAALSPRQPHRFVTSGFLHGSLLHLLLNVNAFRSLPAWLETGLGASLYLTTFLTSIVAGTFTDTVFTDAPHTLCLGASGGICGLYGLMYVSLVRMGQHTAAWRVLKGMAVLVVYGLASSNVSNAGHMGGFLAGVVLTVLAGPTYRRSYALRRKNSVAVDSDISKEYRSVMGYDKLPSARGLVPLPLLWCAALIYFLSEARFRSMPRLVWRGLTGSLL